MQEQQELTQYVQQHKLVVTYILNTHGHIDHMLGNAYCVKYWEVPLIAHPKSVRDLESSPQWGKMMGLNVTPSPSPDQWIEEGDTIEFGQTQLQVWYTPGHCGRPREFFQRCRSAIIISGDVLFAGSIGRTDLPGGSLPILMKSIEEKLLPLDDQVQVHCGHGPSTTIGKERKSNPFILQYL